MNKQGHIIWSQMIMIIGLMALLTLLLQEYNIYEVLTALIFGLAVFLLGVTLPDWDHPQVQKKIIVIRWLKNITSHRGHWHSLIAMCIYGGILFLIIIPFEIEYWYWIVGSGMGGYFSHLAEDQIHKAVKKTNSRNSLKVW